MRKPTRIGVVIPAVATVIAALIGIYPSLRKPKSNTTIAGVVAGIVVDQDTNEGIAQATVVVAGRAEQYITEDTGNFRIDLRTGAPQRLRLHVSKSGFQPLDRSVESPIENLVLQLRKQ